MRRRMLARLARPVTLENPLSPPVLRLVARRAASACTPPRASHGGVRRCARPHGHSARPPEPVGDLGQCRGLRQALAPRRPAPATAPRRRLSHRIAREARHARCRRRLGARSAAVLAARPTQAEGDGDEVVGVGAVHLVHGLPRACRPRRRHLCRRPQGQVSCVASRAEGGAIDHGADEMPATAKNGTSSASAGAGFPTARSGQAPTAAGAGTATGAASAAPPASSAGSVERSFYGIAYEVRLSSVSRASLIACSPRK